MQSSPVSWCREKLNGVTRHIAWILACIGAVLAAGMALDERWNQRAFIERLDRAIQANTCLIIQNQRRLTQRELASIKKASQAVQESPAMKFRADELEKEILTMTTKFQRQCT